MLDARSTPLVQVEDLKMHFPIYTGIFRKHTGDVKAVDGVSFHICTNRPPVVW
jgi:oligopeptide transport system ATP-binding protein